MPVIVVGADTPEGGEIISRFLADGDREVRAFVTDETTAAAIRGRGAKVALGDVSDESHIEAAAAGCFSAVLVASATTDQRERSFAGTEAEVLSGWARAVKGAGVTRTIWVIDGAPPSPGTSDHAVVGPTEPDLPGLVHSLDDAQAM